MRKLSEETRKELITDIGLLLMHSVSEEYYQTILNSYDGVGGSGASILHDIIENVIECSAWKDEGYYTESDIRLAIGRVLMERIGIEYE